MVLVVALPWCPSKYFWGNAELVLNLSLVAGMAEIKNRVGPVTDLSKWRLCCNEKGRQRWMFVEGEVEEEDLRGTEREQDFIELHGLGLDTVSCNCSEWIMSCYHVTPTSPPPPPPPPTHTQSKTAIWVEKDNQKH